MNCCTRVLVLVMLLSIFNWNCIEVFADTYQWFDTDGSVHFSDNPQGIPKGQHSIVRKEVESSMSPSQTPVPVKQIVKQNRVDTDAIIIPSAKVDPVEDAQIRSIWETLLRRLRDRDVKAAVKLFCDESKDQYFGIFTALGNTLPKYADDLRSIGAVYIEGRTAQYRTRRYEPQGLITYYIDFIKNDRGLWEIQQF